METMVKAKQFCKNVSNYQLKVPFESGMKWSVVVTLFAVE